MRVHFHSRVVGKLENVGSIFNFHPMTQMANISPVVKIASLIRGYFVFMSECTYLLFCLKKNRHTQTNTHTNVLKTLSFRYLQKEKSNGVIWGEREGQDVRPFRPRIIENVIKKIYRIRNQCGGDASRWKIS